MPMKMFFHLKMKTGGQVMGADWRTGEWIEETVASIDLRAQDPEASLSKGRSFP